MDCCRLSLLKTEEEREEICKKAKEWALLHGVVMKSKSSSDDSVMLAPFTLMPTRFKRSSFEEVVKLQASVNELLHNIAHNHEFLVETLKSTIEGDEFTRRLFNIYDTVRNEGFKQSISLGILRTDYFENIDLALKQVEMNTVACSFSALASKMSRFHRYVLKELGDNETVHNLPENNALQEVARGIFMGWQYFGNPESCIVFVVEEVTYNIADQKYLEFEVRGMAGAPMIMRKTLKDIAERGKLDEKSNLIIDGSIVGLFYFRVGYDPSQYPTELEWDARLMMERSTAIKCPTIQMHLAGTKKVQQKLAEPGELEKHTNNPLIRKTFVSIYSLDSNEAGDKAVQLGLTNPEKFVLKPQREGGGHNYYDDEVAQALKQMSPSERAAHILMERIHPPPCENIHPTECCLGVGDIWCHNWLS